VPWAILRIFIEKITIKSSVGCDYRATFDPVEMAIITYVFIRHIERLDTFLSCIMLIKAIQSQE